MSSDNVERKKIEDTKLKPLSPSLRVKKRVIRVKIVSDKKFDFKEISESLFDELIWYVGAIDFGKAGIWIIRERFDYDKQEIIFKVGTSYLNKLLAGIALVKQISNSPVKLEFIAVSGTLKGLGLGKLKR